MRAVIQRVSSASVEVEGKTVGAIGPGLTTLVGVRAGDTEDAARRLAEKVVHLRVFEDAEGRMNRSLAETGGGLLAVSQFTLYGDTRKGRRPSFVEAMEPIEANRLYRVFCEACRALGVTVEEGVFRAEMRVALVNEGPVTLIVET